MKTEQPRFHGKLRHAQTTPGLQDIVLHLYDGTNWPVRLDLVLATLDDKSFGVAMSLIKSYRALGAVASEIDALGRAIAIERNRQLDFWPKPRPPAAKRRVKAGSA